MAVAKKAVRTVKVGKPLRASASSVLAKSRNRVDDIMKKRVDAVVEVAKQAGLLARKAGPALVAEAKKLTGLQSDTDLLEFALANVALKDDFPEKPTWR